MSCASFSMLDGPGKNDAHGIEKLLLKFLHSEVDLIIQYFIVQDQDGQTNNYTGIKSCISRWLNLKYCKKNERCDII